ncbi:Tex-like N-terminal domain-containing protein, partial [uncultured Fibrobacter sp.]
MDFSAIIAEELNLEVWRVSKALELMDQGGTIPFIARYRKDQTGTLNEIELRD